MTWAMLFIACVLFGLCFGSPTRRHFVPETSSPVPVATSESVIWEDTDDFDLDGDEDWTGKQVSSPSTIPLRQDYDDYDDEDDSKDNDEEQQDAEEEDDAPPPAQSPRDSPEFLFLPATDTRLMLQDDDGDQSGLIKVRHTGKNSYSEVESNSLEDSSKDDDDDEPFEFTLGGDDDEKTRDDDLQKDDDFVLEDSQAKDSAEDQLPKRRDEDDDSDEDEGFESPEEDSQVIYGDHVFLY